MRITPVSDASKVFIRWSLIGAVFAGFLIWTQSLAVGGVTDCSRFREAVLRFMGVLDSG